MTTPIPDLTGYIFESNGYWKITGPKEDGHGWYGRGGRGPKHYPCVKCTKHGKEFTRRNHYADNIIEGLYRDGAMVKCGLTEDVKVSTDGKASGIRKRRIAHLTDEVNRNLDELNKLLKADGASYTYTLSQR